MCGKLRSIYLLRDETWELSRFIISLLSHLFSAVTFLINYLRTWNTIENKMNITEEILILALIVKTSECGVTVLCYLDSLLDRDLPTYQLSGNKLGLYIVYVYERLGVRISSVLRTRNVWRNTDVAWTMIDWFVIFFTFQRIRKYKRELGALLLGVDKKNIRFWSIPLNMAGRRTLQPLTQVRLYTFVGRDVICNFYYLFIPLLRCADCISGCELSVSKCDS